MYTEAEMKGIVLLLPSHAMNLFMLNAIFPKNKNRTIIRARLLVEVLVSAKSH